MLNQLNKTWKMSALYICNCKCIIRCKTYYKNPENSNCIENRRYAKIISKFTRNWNMAIWSSQNVFNCIEDFLHQTRPQIIKYWSYNKFSTEAFINDLQNTFFQCTLQFQIIREWGVGGSTDNLNINKRGEGERADKRRGLKIVLSQKWQPVITKYGDCFG